MALGAGPIIDYMKRYGFFSVPPLETPLDERVPSGRYKSHRLDHATHDADPGRLAFGQADLLVTPFQMAMVAGAIANHGVLMRPYVVQKILSPTGGVLLKRRPDKLGRPIKPQTAPELTSMMEAVVTGGTGTAAQIS